MRRERVAAVDPFAAPQPSNSAAAPANTSNNNNAQQPQQEKQTSSTNAPSTTTTTSTTNNNVSGGFFPSSSHSTRPAYHHQQTNLLFDPFFKSSAKSHASHNNNTSTQKQTATAKTTTASLMNNTTTSKQQDTSGTTGENTVGDNITNEINSLFTKSEQQHLQIKKEEADEKWKQENEGKLFSPAEIAKKWKREATLCEGLLSFAGSRKASLGMIPAVKKEDVITNNLKKEEGETTLAEDSAPSTTTKLGADENNSNVIKPDDELMTNENQEQQCKNNFSLPFILDPLPECEWWDRPFLAAPSYALGPSKTLPPLGGATAAKSDDLKLTSFTLKKASALVFSSSSSSSSSATTTTTICALPVMVGWNPQENDEKSEARLEQANEAAMAMKTPEELKKERHARRMAAAKERQEQQKAEKADEHNFGLQRSIQIGNGGESGSQQQQNSSSGLSATDKVKVRHLNSVLIKDVLLNPNIGKQVREAQIERLRKHLETNEQRHIDAKDHQQDHEFEVDKRHALNFPRMIVVRCLGITDNHTVQRFKIICKQDLLLRGIFVWIRRQYLVAVLVGGESSIRSAEQMFLDRFLGNDKILREGTQIDVVWGCTLSERAFSRSFLVEYSPFERDGRCKKPESWIKRELEKKQNPSMAMMISGGGTSQQEQKQQNNNDQSDDALLSKNREREYRRKYESIKVMEVPNMVEAKTCFSKYNLEYLWDAVIRS